MKDDGNAGAGPPPEGAGGSKTSSGGADLDAPVPEIAALAEPAPREFMAGVQKRIDRKMLAGDLLQVGLILPLLLLLELIGAFFSTPDRSE